MASNHDEFVAQTQPLWDNSDKPTPSTLEFWPTIACGTHIVEVKHGVVIQVGVLWS